MKNIIDYVIHILTRGKREKERLSAVQDTQIKLNDLEASVTRRKNLSEETRESFKRTIEIMREIVPFTSLDTLKDVRAKLNNTHMSLVKPGMENLIFTYFTDIFWAICEGQNVENVDSALNEIQLQARLALIGERQKQLAEEIAAIGGVEKATLAQRKDWNRLELLKSRVTEMIEIATVVKDKDDIIKYLNDAETQLKLYDPSYKAKKIPANATVNDLKKIYVEYQAALRNAMNNPIIPIDTESNKWINPPIPKETEPVVPDNVYTPSTANISNTPISNNQAESELYLRDIKAGVSELENKISTCDKELSVIDEKRVAQDALMKSLLEQYKNEQLTPAQKTALESKIHNLQRQRTTLQRSRNMWENAKTQANNALSIMAQLEEANKVDAIQNIESLGIGSIDDLAMKLKSYIEKMNENLNNAEMAIGLIDDMVVETGHFDEVPMLETEKQTSGTIEGLFREFNI
jgi:hypothetical protein